MNFEKALYKSNTMIEKLEAEIKFLKATIVGLNREIAVRGKTIKKLQK